MPTRNHIDLVEKNMRVLEALAKSEDELSLKDLVAQVELVKSSVYRILFTLKELGYVEQTERGSYRPTIKMWALARVSRARLDIASLAQPHLARLSDTLDESAWLAERRGLNVVLISGIEASHPLYLSLRIGDLCPLHASASGKSIAAFMSPEELSAALGQEPWNVFTARTLTGRAALDEELEAVRRLGYAVNEEEAIEGARVIGAPVFDATGRACAAISASAPIARCTDSKRSQMIDPVLQAAAGLSADLAGVGFHSPTRPID